MVVRGSGPTCEEDGAAVELRPRFCLRAPRIYLVLVAVQVDLCSALERAEHRVRWGRGVIRGVSEADTARVSVTHLHRLVDGEVGSRDLGPDEESREVSVPLRWSVVGGQWSVISGR